MDLLSPTGVKISVSDELGEKLVDRRGYKRRSGAQTKSETTPAPTATPDKPKIRRRPKEAETTNE